MSDAEGETEMARMPSMWACRAITREANPAVPPLAFACVIEGTTDEIHDKFKARVIEVGGEALWGRLKEIHAELCVVRQS